MKGQLWVWNPYQGHRYDPHCCVYRIYEPDTAELLYVGQTCVSLYGRVKAHWKTQPWFVWYWDKAVVTYEEYPDKLSAMVAEAEAICVEKPRYNKDRPDPEAIRAWAEKWRAMLTHTAQAGVVA